MLYSVYTLLPFPLANQMKNSPGEKCNHIFFAFSNDVKKKKTNRGSIRSTSVYSVNEECAFKINSGAPVLVGALTDNNLVSQLR